MVTEHESLGTTRSVRQSSDVSLTERYLTSHTPRIDSAQQRCCNYWDGVYEYEYLRFFTQYLSSTFNVAKLYILLEFRSPTLRQQETGVIFDNSKSLVMCLNK